jgi:hypothetical protein
MPRRRPSRALTELGLQVGGLVVIYGHGRTIRLPNDQRNEAGQHWEPFAWSGFSGNFFPPPSRTGSQVLQLVWQGGWQCSTFGAHSGQRAHREGRLRRDYRCRWSGPRGPGLDLCTSSLPTRPRQVLRERLACEDLEWHRGKEWAFEQALGAVWYYVDSNAAMSHMDRRTLEHIWPTCRPSWRQPQMVSSRYA